MKDSVLRTVVLVVLVIVFAAVVITSRWVDEPTYAQISCPSGNPDEIASEGISTQHQASRVDAQADTGQTEPEMAFSAAWAGRPDDNLDEPEQQAGSAAGRSSRLTEEPDEGAEPPDDNKDTYGTDDVE